MSNPRCYRIGGMVVRSEVTLPAFAASDEAPDVNIRFGSVPAAIADPTACGPSWEATPQALLLHLGTAGRCLVQNGDEIIVDSAAERHADLSSPLLGTAMGAICHQRGLLPLHASAVATEAGCVAFAGHSGAGKSTLVAFLAQNGYRLLGDDVCPVSVSDVATPFALPWIPRVRLLADAAAAMKVGGETDAADKFAWSNTDQFLPHPVPLRRIYILDAAVVDEPTFTKLSAINALGTVDKNTYRRRIVREAMGRADAHFRACSAVVDAVPVFQMSTPRLLARLDDTLEALELHLSQPVDSRQDAT